MSKTRGPEKTHTNPLSSLQGEKITLEKYLQGSKNEAPNLFAELEESWFIDKVIFKLYLKECI